ncbi:MAG: AAA family ATPase [Candidatus Micrarchaeota archaeon]
MVNPFTPGNGIEPHFLAGRDKALDEFTRSLKAFENGLPQNTVVYGLRGTGKTVLARRFKIIAETRGWAVVEREFNEKFAQEELLANSLSSDIVSTAAEVSVKKKIEQAGKKLLDTFKPETLSAYGITYTPYYRDEVKLFGDYIKGILLSNWPVFHKAGKKGVILLYDEMHHVRDIRETKQYGLSSLLEALSYVQREGCRYSLCAVGLPSLKINLKDAKTYTERMFNFQETSNLPPEEARKALLKPLMKTGYSFDKVLTARIVSETNGYPYFLQFYGYYLIENSAKKRLTLADFEDTHKELLSRLDKSFFEDRFKLASDGEKKVLTAMAHADEEEISTKEIAQKTKASYGAIIELLVRLSEKGLVYRVKKGKYSFTIPLFRNFLKRQSKHI